MAVERLRIAGYGRISVDLEEDGENTSIENQHNIISKYVSANFPDAEFDFYADRDRSGYTFDQREHYQEMRPKLLNGHYTILVVKDFSRFARRNSKGLVELEDLRDAGLRIISIDDGVDYPKRDDWLAIQFRFLINEMPVTDASKKVKSVVHSRQNDGRWICAVPYGYVITDTKKMTFEVDEAAAQVVRLVFSLYNDGWGYKKISNYLTEKHIPTPRQVELARKLDSDSEREWKIKARPEWSIVTVQGILDNDFYIGTLRQGKYTRAKINGKDVKKDESDHIIFENHHEAIVDYRTFAVAQENRKRRTKDNYRGQKKYDTAYSGYLFCGDCGSPLFSMSRPDLAPAYTCGTYHRRGTNGCTSHHTRVDELDKALKRYVKRVRDGSEAILAQLNEAISHQEEDQAKAVDTIKVLQKQLEDAQTALKNVVVQKALAVAQHPEQATILEETYAGAEKDLLGRVAGLQEQIEMSLNSYNDTVRVNRAAQTVFDVFNNILNKEKLSKSDLSLIVDRITVYTDYMDIKLKADVDALLRAGTLQEAAANFKLDSIDSLLSDTIVQVSARRPDKVYTVNVISGGDPLEIYTDKEGGVIFKKYSLMGGLGDFASQMCETLHKTTGRVAVITDRDTCIAVHGTARREMADKRVSAELESIMEGRQIYQWKEGEEQLPICEDGEKYLISAAAPILSEGDVLGCVIFAAAPGDEATGETEYKLVQTIAGFLGRHMES